MKLHRVPMMASDDTINAYVDNAAALTVAEFKRLGDKASFHLADDSCREWDQGYKAKAEALKVFDEHPELEAQFREIAEASFLWSLDRERPPVPEDNT